MVDYSGALGRAWKYTASKRLGAAFLFFLVTALIAVSPLFFVYKTLSLGLFNLVTLIQFFVWFLAGLVVAVLVFLYAMLLFTHNYANQKSLKKSASFALSSYPRFMAVVIVTGIITFIVSAVPFIGIILSIVAGLMFFFTYQEVAFKSSFSKSIRNSYDMFMKNKLDTVVTFIVTAVLALFILLIFAIPLFAVGFSAVLSSLSGVSLMQSLMANISSFMVAGIILLAGASFAILFTNSIKTDVYMQLKKKRK